VIASENPVLIPARSNSGDAQPNCWWTSGLRLLPS